MKNLLVERFEIIADFPKNIFKVGDVLNHLPYSLNAYHTDMYPEGECLDITVIKKYPHLFKKLEWWENRNKTEMPEFVKTNDLVMKIEMWDMDFMFGIEKIKGSIRHGCDLPLWKGHDNQYLPATKKEYTAFLNSL